MEPESELGFPSLSLSEAGGQALEGLLQGRESAAPGVRVKNSSREERGGVGRTGKPISTGDREKLSEGQCCENTPWTDCLGRQGALEKHWTCLLSPRA